MFESTMWTETNVCKQKKSPRTPPTGIWTRDFLFEGQVLV